MEPQNKLTLAEYEKWVSGQFQKPIDEVYKMGFFIKPCECGVCCGWSCCGKPELVKPYIKVYNERN